MGNHDKTLGRPLCILHLHLRSLSVRSRDQEAALRVLLPWKRPAQSDGMERRLGSGLCVSVNPSVPPFGKSGVIFWNEPGFQTQQTHRMGFK